MEINIAETVRIVLMLIVMAKGIVCLYSRKEAIMERFKIKEESVGIIRLIGFVIIIQAVLMSLLITLLNR